MAFSFDQVLEHLRVFSVDEKSCSVTNSKDLTLSSPPMLSSVMLAIGSPIGSKPNGWRVLLVTHIRLVVWR